MTTVQTTSSTCATKFEDTCYFARDELATHDVCVSYCEAHNAAIACPKTQGAVEHLVEHYRVAQAPTFDGSPRRSKPGEARRR